jgi:formate hydrogenlyase transcriptional activator
MSSATQPEARRPAQQQVVRERDRLRLLLDVTNMLVANRNFREVFANVSEILRRELHHDYAALSLYSPAQNTMRVYAIDFPGSSELIAEGKQFASDESPSGYTQTTRRPLLVDNLFSELTKFPAELTELLQEGIRSGCWLPLINRDRVVGVLTLGSKREAAFTREDVDLLTQVGNQAALTVDNALAFRKIAELNRKLAQEKHYLEDEIRTEYNVEGIVGKSPALKRILQKARTVARTQSTVLILGETGTGKELIARAIHNLSDRRERTFVKLNCAAIPTGLLESELFGHEKGAFTGAISQKVGRIELAHHGTLFLDEVGDIPLELQPKLLRVLQEKEFERLGSTRTISVDVRLIAATNRDLGEMVASREFRSDLFYRLNVFPITVPPLRERASDIPLLVRYFVERHAAEQGKRITRIPADSMKALVNCSWPGNIRELENFLERAVILSQEPVLTIPVAELSGEVAGQPLKTLEESERDHILRALRAARGVIAGPQGAAARLGMKRTTLNSRIRKLGISRDEVWA